MEGVVTCAACCSDSTPLLGCHDGTIWLGSNSCTHSLDTIPIVCCTSAETGSGAVLVVACTRETLHLRLLDKAEPSCVLQEHHCPLNTIIPENSDAYSLISPCLKHILVADGGSLSTYSISEAPTAASYSESHPSLAADPHGINIKLLKLSMTFHAPGLTKQVTQEYGNGEMTLPVAYWRTQQPVNSSSSPSTHILKTFCMLAGFLFETANFLGSEMSFLCLTMYL